MKFNVLIVLTCSLILGCSESTQTPPDYNGFYVTKTVTTGSVLFSGTVSTEFDENNRILISKIDRESNGDINAVSLAYLNKLGQVSSIHSDQDNDDVLDLVITFEYNENNLVSKTFLDTDNDKSNDIVRHIEWSEENKILSQRDEKKEDGSIFLVNSYDWSIAGKVTSELDGDNDGMVDSISISYTNESNYVHRRDYLDGELNLLNYDIFSYDEHGNLIKEEAFNSNDESIFVMTRTYEKTPKPISNQTYSWIDIGLRQ